MRVIVPGGCYSYDSAGKKIWLDYQYYGTTLENIERIKNLTRNKILYDNKLSKEPVTVSNGCITHSYQGTEADTDKIQITLRTPILDSLTELEAVDGVISLETTGKKLVLPSGNADILPLFNELTIKPTLLTLAESPFGGYKGTPADYCVGTISTPTDGVYLQDLTGQNSSKVLGAGKLKELSLMSVDTVNHSITEEFQVVNTSESNNPVVVDDCNEVRSSILLGTGEISVENGRLKVTGTTSSSGYLVVKQTTAFSISQYNFLVCSIESNAPGYAYIGLENNYSNYVRSANKPSVAVRANVNEKIILAFRGVVSETGMSPNSVIGSPNWSSPVLYRVGFSGQPNISVTFYVDNITADTGKTATIEIQTPNNLSATSLSLHTHNGTAYQLCSTHSLDDAYAQVSQTSANCTFLDSTKLDDVYGAAGAGRAVFPKGSAGETKAGSSGSITYSPNQGTDKRIGLKVDLPPSDNRRTNFNKVRLKLVVNYATDAGGIRSATHIFADSTNTSYGLQNLSKPWIALYDPADSLIDFYLFTHRPQNLQFKRDETGTIYSLSLYPGAGSVYHGQIPFADLTLDSDSNSVPDCLEAAVNGSVTKFLANYSYANTTQFLIDSNDYYLLDSDDKTLEV